MRRPAAGFMRNWLALALCWSLVAGTIVFVAHWQLRTGANDPQVQMAEDAARQLAAGIEPAAVVPRGGVVPVESSLATWLAVYDANGTPLLSSGSYAGKAPDLPGGVLEFARKQGGHRLSWQPRPGVRQALVVVPVPDAGYVVAGRSLREVEARKQQVLELVLLAWLVGLAGLLLPALLLPSRNGS
jgi:hypothetical protein